MRHLRTSDFNLSDGVANIPSAIATYQVPKSVFLSLEPTFPYLLAISGYFESTAIDTASAGGFTLTAPGTVVVPTDENGKKLYTITASALDLTTGAGPVTPTSVSGNDITFPQIASGSASSNVACFYRIGDGSCELSVKSGTSNQESHVIMTGSLLTLNAVDQFSAKTQSKFLAAYPASPSDTITLTVTSPQVTSMNWANTTTGSAQNTNWQQAGKIDFPINVVNQ